MAVACNAVAQSPVSLRPFPVTDALTVLQGLGWEGGSLYLLLVASLVHLEAKCDRPPPHPSSPPSPLCPAPPTPCTLAPHPPRPRALFAPTLHACTLLASTPRPPTPGTLTGTLLAPAPHPHYPRPPPLLAPWPRPRTLLTRVLPLLAPSPRTLLAPSPAPARSPALSRPPALSVPAPCPLGARSALARAPRRRLRRVPALPAAGAARRRRRVGGCRGPGAEHEPPPAPAARCSGPDCGARAARERRGPGPR